MSQNIYIHDYSRRVKYGNMFESMQNQEKMLIIDG